MKEPMPQDEWHARLTDYQHRLDQLATRGAPKRPASPKSPRDEARDLDRLRRRHQELANLIRLTVTSPDHMLSDRFRITQGVTDLGREIAAAEREDR